MLAAVNSGVIVGLEAQPVRVEVDFNAAGMPGFTIVGLPDAAVQESRERVRAAVKNRGLAFPLKRYTVNLAPADVRKSGPDYDLPIAMGVLVATEQIPPECLEGAVFIGELSLDGSLRHARGVIALAAMAREQGLTTFYVPDCDAEEAAIVEGIDVIPVPSLGHLVEHLYRLNVIPPIDRSSLSPREDPLAMRFSDLQDVKG